jgi:hypothetical protein
VERLFLVVNGDHDTEAAGWDFDGVHSFVVKLRLGKQKAEMKRAGKKRGVSSVER